MHVEFELGREFYPCLCQVKVARTKLITTQSQPASHDINIFILIFHTVNNFGFNSTDISSRFFEWLFGKYLNNAICFSKGKLRRKDGDRDGENEI